MNKFRVIIPTRYASVRLPQKMLADIHGQSLLERVYSQAMLSSAQEVLIATDHEHIFNHAKNFGASVFMTRVEHQSGTERIAELVSHLGFDDEDIIVNVQGDLPLVSPAIINEVARYLWENPELPMATLCQPIYKLEEIQNPHVVKVLLNAQQHAIYFSRQVIPWSPTLSPPYYKHIGLYAYRVGFIKQYVKWPACQIEQLESLEQLRAIWYGAKIFVGIHASADSPSIDTQEDLEKVREMVAAS